MEPINLNQSWDYSEEKKKYYLDLKEKERLARIKAQEELEERKNTPGYCCECGAANADYVADPYYEEMYGDIHIKWLCSNCYSDSAMSV